MFYEYFWFVLGLAAFFSLAATVVFTSVLPQRERYIFSNHGRTVAWLAKDPLLHPKNASTFSVQGEPNSQLWVSPSGLCILWVKAPAKSPNTEPAGPLGTPTAVNGWLTCWVDPRHWHAPLPQMRTLRDALSGKGEWAQLSKKHGLELSQCAQGMPMLKGQLHGRNVAILTTGRLLETQAEVDPSLYAKPGTGHSGNAVLDLCMDTRGIPGALVVPILELLHQEQGGCEDGQLTTLWRGGLGELLGNLDILLAHGREAP